MYKFLIYISYSYSIPIGKPLQEEIERRGYEVFWFSEIESTKQYFTKNEKVLSTVKDILQFNPDIVLTATDNVAHFFPGIKVQIFHGFLSNKRQEMNSHFKIRGFFDLYTTQGPSTTKIFQQLAKKYGYFEAIETGWSKVDPLFPLSKKEETDKPVILISSTFTSSLSLAKNDLVYQEIKCLSHSGKSLCLCVCVR